MKTTAITQSESVEFCDEINLNIFTKVQSYGVLLILDAQFKIIQCSDNVSELLGTLTEDLLNTSVFNFLKTEMLGTDTFSSFIENKGEYCQGLWSSALMSIPVFFKITNKHNIYYLEVEKYDPELSGGTSFFDLNQRLSASLQKTMNCDSIESLSQIMSEEIKKLTDYDRVLIYRFDEHDQAGVVVGEAIKPGMDSYLGLHFPPNDVPKSVRDMYLELPMRYIPNRLASPVTMVPETNPISGAPTDLTPINLRMVAPVHNKYLENMGISGCISIAIIIDQKLWGLIACHHHHAHQLSLNRRLIFPIIADMYAANVKYIESSEDLRDEGRANQLHAVLSQSLEGVESLTDSLEGYHRALMKIVDATGMSLYIQNVLLNYGNTPSENEVHQLIQWLSEKNDFTVFSTSTLPEEYPRSIDFRDSACGLLTIKIIPSGSHYLLFYKPEKINTIAWAGNPCQAVIRESNDDYSPRASFARFLVTIQNQSTPWKKHDVSSTTLIHSLIAAKLLQEVLQDEVVHDPLTTLFNRRHLEQTLALEIHRSNREKTSLAVLILDVDYFKKINDTYGHLAGDAFLKAFSALLKSQFRPYDYIYRYGGDEFLVIFPNMGREIAEEKALSLMSSAKSMKIRFEETTLPPITLTIGIAVYPQNGQDARTLIAHADNALYQGKKEGRDRIF